MAMELMDVGIISFAQSLFIVRANGDMGTKHLDIDKDTGKM